MSAISTPPSPLLPSQVGSVGTVGTLPSGYATGITPAALAVGVGTLMSGSRAPVNTAITEGRLKLDVMTDRVVAKVAGMDIVTVSLVGVTINLCGSNLPTVTCQHKVSSDGLTWTRLAGTTDVTSEGLSIVAVSGWPMYCLEVTSIAASTCFARVIITGKSNS